MAVVFARVTCPVMFINDRIHVEGETLYVDTDALGVKKLGEETPGLVAEKEEAAVKAEA